jgi:hypothetical protein
VTRRWLRSIASWNLSKVLSDEEFWVMAFFAFMVWNRCPTRTSPMKFINFELAIAENAALEQQFSTGALSHTVVCWTAY